MKNTGTLQVTTPTDREIVHDPRLRCPAPAGLGRLYPTRAAQKVVRTRGWSLSGLRGRSAGRRRLPLRHARPGRPGTWACAASIARSLRPERSVHVETFDDYPGESHVTSVFTEQNGKTTLTVTVEYPSREVRDIVISTGMEHGAAESYDKLAELLASQPATIEVVTPSAYPAGRTAAAGIRTHLRHETPAAPGVDAIEAMIEAAFWASLRREEGYVPRISLAFVPPETPLPLLLRAARCRWRRGARQGRAGGRTSRHPPRRLARRGREFQRLGHRPARCRRTASCSRSSAPACWLSSTAAREAGKFVNVAVLEGDQIKMVDERASSLPDCPDCPDLAARLRYPATISEDSVNVLVQLAVSMRAHGRGGSLLVVPRRSRAGATRSSSRFPTPSSPPSPALAELVRAGARRGTRRRAGRAPRGAMASPA